MKTNKMDPTIIIEIASVIKEIYALYDNMNSLLERRAKKMLSKALNYLGDPNANEKLIRQALEKIEIAYDLLDDKPVLKAFERKSHRNELCYYIAKLHYDLGDPYDSTTHYWTSFLDLRISLPDGFKQILKEKDWDKLKYEFERYHIDYSELPDLKSIDDPLYDYIAERNKYD